MMLVLLTATLTAALTARATSSPPLQAPLASCKVFNDTDFNGHDLKAAHGVAGPDACCGVCQSTAGCGFWTYMPGGNVCYMKTSDAGRRPSPSGHGTYVSGCKDSSCAPAPPAPPAPPPPPPFAPGGPPPPHGGGTCASEWDCSLGGLCSAGKCVCDAQYTGEHCAVLRLRRAKLDNGMQMNGTHTWGGHALKDKTSGKWVGFFSYMAGLCDLGTWGSNSMIVSAVSDLPDGPYSQKPTPVVGPWSHNAMISQHPNGSYVLFHIGSGKLKSTPFKPCSAETDPFYPFPAEDPEPPLATTHISESLHGPWRAAPGVPALNNPCPFFFENGTTLIFDRTSVVVGQSLDGPWDSQHRPTVAVNGSMHPEDPGVYRDQRGNFHMLFNANSGHSNCRAGTPCGGHAWSHDGLTWSAPYWPAFGTITHYVDNTTAQWNYVERPQIAQMTDGTPLTFFAGHGYGGIHTLAFMFCQSGDTDCVTTVQ
jgi:hypothetical protein